MKFDEIFSRVDTIHQRDGQTPGDSKDRAYAYRRTVKMNLVVTRLKLKQNVLCDVHTTDEYKRYFILFLSIYVTAYKLICSIEIFILCLSASSAAA